MKTFNRFAILCAALLGCISCTSCSKSPTTTPSSPNPCENGSCPLDSGVPQEPENYQEFKGDGWSISVTDDWQRMDMNDPTFQLILAESKHQSALMLIKEPYQYTGVRYLFDFIQGVGHSGGVVTAVETVQIRGEYFDLLDISKGDLKLWAWVTVKNGYGYNLLCGGASSSPEMKDSCFKAVSTFKVL